jgi:excisionase family DNA binding protein
MFLTVKELSKYLMVKPSTLYAWSSRGIIPHYKVHGLLRFKQDEIDVWINAFHKDKPATNVPSFKRKNHNDIDSIIERVKREVYNLPHRRPDRIRAGKDGD